MSMSRKENKSNSVEPYFYIALVLKGTEKQYLNLLKYVDKRNGAQVIYQCKSLTYLKVNREDHVKLQMVNDEASIEVPTRGVKNR